MKTRDNTYEALLRSAKAQELEAVTERNAILAVVEERLRVVDSIRSSIDSLEKRYLFLVGEHRAEMARQGRASQAASSVRLAHSVKEEISRFESELTRATEDLRRAQEREQEADEMLTEARIERKKAEMLLSRSQEKKRVSNAAREEILLDEAQRRDRGKD